MTFARLTRTTKTSSHVPSLSSALPSRPVPYESLCIEKKQMELTSIWSRKRRFGARKIERRRNFE